MGAYYWLRKVVLIYLVTIPYRETSVKIIRNRSKGQLYINIDETTWGRLLCELELQVCESASQEMRVGNCEPSSSLNHQNLQPPNPPSHNGHFHQIDIFCHFFVRQLLFLQIEVSYIVILLIRFFWKNMPLKICRSGANDR